MNFDDYKTNFLYPNKKDYKTFTVYHDGKCLFYKQKREVICDEIDAPISKGAGFISDLQKHGFVVEQIIDEDGYKTHLQEYMDDQKRLKAKFAEDLHDEFGVSDNPKRDVLFSIAWDKGHSDGYSEVYYHYAELVPLIED